MRCNFMIGTVVEDKIEKVFEQRLHIQAPSRDADLIESGTIDSLTFVELLAHLEEEFSIRIPLDNLDISQFRSIVRIGEFIQAQLSTPEVSSGSYPRI